jgi:hypothetical protein
MSQALQRALDVALHGPEWELECRGDLRVRQLVVEGQSQDRRRWLTEAGQLVGRNSRDIEAVLGAPGRAEMIHRDDMALVGD